MEGRRFTVLSECRVDVVEDDVVEDTDGDDYDVMCPCGYHADVCVCRDIDGKCEGKGQGKGKPKNLRSRDIDGKGDGKDKGKPKNTRSRDIDSKGEGKGEGKGQGKGKLSVDDEEGSNRYEGVTLGNRSCVMELDTRMFGYGSESD